MSSGVRARLGRWRRPVRRGLIVLGIVVVLLPLVVLAALQSRTVRRVVLDRIATAVESGSGIVVSAGDFNLRPWSGTLEIDGIALRASNDDPRPFLTVSRIRGEIAWGSLIRDRTVLHSVRIEEPVLDLEASLPVAADDDAERSPRRLPGIDVLEIELVGGSVRSAALDERMDVWLDNLRIRDVVIRGAYLSNRLEVGTARAVVVVESHRRDPIEAVLGASLSVTPGGAFGLDDLEIRGTGLSIDLEGHGGRVGTGAGALAFELDAEPALLFPDLTSGGRLEVRGELGLSRSPGRVLSGEVEIDASELPADLLGPWIESARLGNLELQGTRIDLDAGVELGIALEDVSEDWTDAFRGEAKVSWRRGRETLLAASVRTPVATDPPMTRGIRLGVEAEVLPGFPGRRRLWGKIAGRNWIDVEDWELHDARLDVFEPDLGNLTRQLGFHADAFGGFRPVGELTIDLVAAGRILAPGLELDAGWLVDGETLATVRARSPKSGGSGVGNPLEVTIEATVLPASPGQRELSGTIVLTGWHDLANGALRGGRLSVSVPDIGEAESGLRSHLRELLSAAVLPAWLNVDDPVTDAYFLSGALRTETTMSGPFNAPDVATDTTWEPAPGETIRLLAHGVPTWKSPYFAGPLEADLAIRGLDLSRYRLTPGADGNGVPEPIRLGGRVEASGHVSGTAERFRASLEVEGVSFRHEGGLEVDELRLEARTDGDSLEVPVLSGRIDSGTEPPLGGPFEIRGRAAADWPPRSAMVRFEIRDPAPGFDRIGGTVRLEDGTLRVEGLEIASDSGVASVEAAIPLEILGAPPDWIPPARSARDPVTVNVSSLDLEPWLSLLDPASDFPQVSATVDGAVSLDPADPVSATGRIEISGLAVEYEGESVAANRPIRLVLEGGRVVLSPVHLEASGSMVPEMAPLDVSGSLDLSRAWRPGDDPGTLVTGLEFRIDGAVESSVFNPFLAGGIAAGEVAIRTHARGPLDALTADVLLRGPEASLLYPRPYATRIEAPEVVLTARENEVVLDTARARLNDGDLGLRGRLTPDDGLHLEATFGDVRYRLAYGVTTRLSGELVLEWPPRGQRRLTGDVVLERAVLRRDINLDREILQALFEPPVAGSTDRILDTIDVDISVTTDEGIQIKNNLADLHADWSRLVVGGTLGSPTLTGRVDVDPGGRVTVLGQTIRIDEGGLVWSGEPPSSPRLQFEITSSLDDPTIKQTWRSSFSQMGDRGPGRGGSLDFWGRGQTESSEVWASMATGMMTQYQHRLAGAMAGGLDRTLLSFEPLPLFGETDTQARFTIAQDLSQYLTFIASSNPREAEAQTYILDIHQVPVAPSLRAQVFTNDQKNAGLTLQQTLRFGGGSTAVDEGPRLGTKTVQVPEGVSKRRVKRSIGFRRDDSFPRGAGLDVEVDVLEEMSRRGYPAAGVDVSVEPASDRRVDLQVTVDPGPRVEFAFEGRKLPRAARREIAAQYHPGNFEDESSLDSVRKITIQILRGMGYPEPEVEVGVEPAELEDELPEGSRTVRVTAHGGRKIDPGLPVIEGIQPDDATRLGSLFGSLRGQVDLAVGDPAADAFLLQSLATIGYPDARIAGRQLSDTGDRLTVRIEPGSRQHIASIRIVGVGAWEATRLAGLLRIRDGDPAAHDRIGRAGHAIEDDFRSRGHAEVRVRTTVEPSNPDDPSALEVVLDVDPGATYRIEGVQFEGLEAAKPQWVERIAGLEDGAWFRSDNIAEARGRLFRTGVFRRIRVSNEPSGGKSGNVANGDPGPDDGAIGRTVTFRLEEGPRYQLSYGGRWESGRGLGVVVDALDRNSLGRGHTSGIRGIYGRDLRSLRLYHVIPRVPHPEGTVEVFAEARGEVISDFWADTLEGWAQLTFPLSRRVQNRLYSVVTKRNLTPRTDDPDAQIDERVISPLLGWQMVYDTSSRGLGRDRRTGIFFGLDLSGSSGLIGSNVSSLAMFQQLKFFLPLGRSKHSRFTWAQSYRIGLVTSFDEPVPLADRLRAGGEFSVRGYPTDSLGPGDAEGIPLGGENMLVINQELHARIWNTVTGLVFLDAGQVWLDQKLRDVNLSRSWGVGLRYVSPVGPLRLDYARPLDRRTGDPGYKVYFGFGNVF